MNFDGLGLCFCFGGWYCLHEEFYSLNSTSVMESVVVKSGGLLHNGVDASIDNMWESGHVRIWSTF